MRTQRRAGAATVALEMVANNDLAQRFYEREGFTTTFVQMHGSALNRGLDGHSTVAIISIKRSQSIVGQKRCDCRDKINAETAVRGRLGRLMHLSCVDLSWSSDTEVVAVITVADVSNHHVEEAAIGTLD